MTKTPFVLNKEDAYRNARQAYLDGRLQVQLESQPRACSYYIKPPKGVTDRCGCAIGVSLPVEIAQMADHCSSWGMGVIVSALPQHCVFSTDNMPALVELQNAHDSMLHHGPERVNLEHRRLRKLLEIGDEVPFNPPLRSE